MSRGPAWTESEVERAESMAAAGMSNKEIGLAIGRTDSAISYKLRTLKIQGFSDASVRAGNESFLAEARRVYRGGGRCA